MKNKKWNSRAVSISLIIMGITGVFLTFFGIGLRIYNYSTFIKNGIETTATVINVEEVHSQDSREEGIKVPSYKLTLNFDCGNAKNISNTTDHASSSYNYNKGEKIQIYCKIGTSKFLIKNRYWLISVIAIFLGGILSYFCIKDIYTKIKYKIRKKQLLKLGFFKDFPVKKISKSNVIINDKNGYYLTFDNGQYQYESETFWFNIWEYIEKDEKFQVYYDPQNPNRYWVNADIIYTRKDNNQYAKTPLSYNDIKTF